MKNLNIKLLLNFILIAAGSLLISAVFVGSLYAQDNRLLHRPLQGARSLRSVKKQVMPAVDVPALVREDEQNQGLDLPPRFAEPIPVQINPENNGTWEQLKDGRSLWRLRIAAADAVSLNFGWTRYHMPASGQLWLYTPDETTIRGPFTVADNAAHGELWSPIVLGDEVVIEVTISPEERSQLELNLTSVNYGYKEFGKSSPDKSGSCNVDVICSQGDAWRDEIRSVAVYSTGGSTFCTGVLVNNTAQDLRPYFLTANHCGMNAGNAASLVTYWNYQNSTCRMPGSPSSGQAGNGSLAQFVTGAFFRASNSASDFTLLEIDEPIPAAYNAYLAGWDNTNTDGTSGVGIHHPNTEEKRISFENDPLATSSYLGMTSPGDGTHVRVVDWDLGTTEPGSSGSPLFNQNHRIVGQLHGGFAACGNDSSDYYGRFSVSWTGGGTNSTRLQNWLDPGNTGAATLNGRSAVAPLVTVNGTKTVSGTFSQGGTVTYTITLTNNGTNNQPDNSGNEFTDTLPAGLTLVSATSTSGTAITNGNTVTWNGSLAPLGGSVTITVTATINAGTGGQTISNQGTISYDGDANGTNETTTTTDDPGVGGSNDPTNFVVALPSADLAITKTDGVTSITAGGSVTYTITASNAGPNTATGATVTDTFPAFLTGVTWTCVGAGGGTCTASGSGNINNTVNLPSGGSVTYTASATVLASATGTLSNTATVTAPAGVTDPTSANNSATDTDTIALSADLAITKTDGVTSVTAGGPVTYTIVASNSGPSNVTGATVADTFPASLTATWTCVGAGGGTCTASGAGNINNTVNLPSGGSVTYTVNATLSPVASGTLTNTATVTAPAGVTDPTPANNSATDTDTIIVPNADLAVIKTDSPDPVTAGNNIVYTIIVSNNGPGNATTATLTDTLPANTTFQSITAPAGWICTTPAVNAGGTVSCTNASLANGASGTFILVVNVNTGTANGTISNTATVSSSVTDPATGNNSSTATTTVAEFVSPAPTGLPPKALLVKPAAGNTTAGAGVSDSSCIAPTGVTVAGTFANINQALGAAGSGDTIYVCPKYSAGLVVPYIEHVSLGFTNLSVVGISDVRGSRAVIAANPSTATSPTTQLGTNYIVQIAATGVNFGNFVVDGAPGGVNYANTGIFNGIVVRRSGAFVFNNTVQNIRTTDSATNANGQGIAVFGAGSAGSPLEGGTLASPVNILNNVVQAYRSNGVNVSAGSSSAYAFVRGNYIIGNGANSGTVNQTGVQFQSGANGDVFNNRITRILDNVAGCSAAAFSNCSAGVRLNTTASSSANNLRVRFNLISNTQTGIFAQDVQFVSMTNNTISSSVIDGINLRGSAFNLGSNFSTINQNTILSARRSGIFIGLVGGDASLGNSLTQNTIEDTFTGVANNTPAGNNTIPTTGATANTFISVNNFVGSATSGVNDVQNTNPLP